MQDLPVRLKRSFEEVCLKYSTRYEIVLFLLPKYEVGLSYRYQVRVRIT
jgi:hypothetical protein